ncbi:MAG: mechanosensitive ion channel family protein [Myxococcales bacterium]|nr:mechanosensitive ion channel family protein [Myxococcales bacterium]
MGESATAVTAPSVGDRIEPTWDRIDRRVTWFIEMLPVIGLALLVIVAFWFLGRLVSRWDLPFRLLATNKLLQQVLRQVVMTLFVLVGLLIGLEIMDATSLVGAVLGAAGVVGLALGFAFKDLVENYLASVLLSIRRPFAANDFISIDGNEGNVVRMTMSDTILMTADGNHLRLPNAKVFNSVMLNFTRNPRRRFDCAVGIGPDESVGAALRLGVEALARTPGVLAEPAPFGRVEALADWTVNLRFFAWVDQRSADYGKAASEGRRRVKTALDREGIAMPNPTYRLETVALEKADLASAKQGQRDAAAREDELAAAAMAHEVEPDTTIDRQIAEDRAQSDEKNLL